MSAVPDDKIRFEVDPDAPAADLDEVLARVLIAIVRKAAKQIDEGTGAP